MRIRHWARQLGLETSFFQTNYEGEYVERLHQATELADACCSTRAPGRTTAMRSATRSRSPGLPAVEVHIIDVDSREEWRADSVIADLVAGVISGEGPTATARR